MELGEAGLPQAALREIVLRLVRPETPPPIAARSGIDFREQQALAPLKPEAVRRLHRSREALDFLNRFNAQAPLLDEVADLFLSPLEGKPGQGLLASPRLRSALAFEEALYACEVVMLGASRPTMERMMGHLVRGGWSRQAEALAGKLGRNLTRDEVLGLVKSYTEGAVKGDESDRFWPAFARRHLGGEGERLAREWIAERNRRWANDLF